jgi:energy-coupling factor transporter ATP-binding protein EcfA2
MNCKDVYNGIVSNKKLPGTFLLVLSNAGYLWPGKNGEVECNAAGELLLQRISNLVCLSSRDKERILALHGISSSGKTSLVLCIHAIMPSGSCKTMIDAGSHTSTQLQGVFVVTIDDQKLGVGGAGISQQNLLEWTSGGQVAGNVKHSSAIQMNVNLAVVHSSNNSNSLMVPSPVSTMPGTIVFGSEEKRETETIVDDIIPYEEIHEPDGTVRKRWNVQRKTRCRDMRILRKFAIEESPHLLKPYVDNTTKITEQLTMSQPIKERVGAPFLFLNPLPVNCRLTEEERAFRITTEAGILLFFLIWWRNGKRIPTIVTTQQEYASYLSRKEVTKEYCPTDWKMHA